MILTGIDVRGNAGSGFRAQDPTSALSRRLSGRSARRSCPPRAGDRLRRVEIEVVEGDITALDVEAIANAANDQPLDGSGRRGRDQACRRRGDRARGGRARADPARHRGRDRPGQARREHVIHGAVMGQDLQTNADLVSRTTRSCLAVADELGAASLALPAFGTGVGGFPLDEAAGIMVAAAREHEPRIARARRLRRLRPRGGSGLQPRARGMKGVILAGGTGTRLHPLTRITNKHLLPIYDRPMVAYAIEALVQAGIRELMLVTGGTHAGRVPPPARQRARVGDRPALVRLPGARGRDRRGARPRRAVRRRRPRRA